MFRNQYNLRDNIVDINCFEVVIQPTVVMADIGLRLTLLKPDVGEDIGLRLLWSMEDAPVWVYRSYSPKPNQYKRQNGKQRHINVKRDEFLRNKLPFLFGVQTQNYHSVRRGARQTEAALTMALPSCHSETNLRRNSVFDFKKRKHS